MTASNVIERLRKGHRGPTRLAYCATLAYRVALAYCVALAYSVDSTFTVPSTSDLSI